MAEQEILFTSTLRSPDHRGPWGIQLHWADVNGRAECVGITVVAGGHMTDGTHVVSVPSMGGLQPITSGAWRTPSFATLINDERPKLTKMFAYMNPEGFARSTWADDSGQYDIRGWPKGHLLAVAETYRAAWPLKPTKAVVEHFNVSKTAAAKWVARCRQLGLLEETTRGRSTAAIPAKKRGKSR